MAENGLSAPPTNQSAEEARFALEREKFKFEKATVLILAIYTGIAAVQAWQMYKATQATRIAANAANDSAAISRQLLTETKGQFLSEQRPIVWVTDIGGPKFLQKSGRTETGQIIWTIHYTNYGKTPANNVKFTKFMKLEDKSSESYGETDGGEGAPLTPGKDDFVTVVSNPGITKDQLNELLKQMVPNGISISMRITYSDAYGNGYETGVCLNRLNMGSVGYCRSGNYVK